MGCLCSYTEEEDGNIQKYKKYIDAYKDIKSCIKLMENNNQNNFNGFLIKVNSIQNFLALINIPKVSQHLDKIIIDLENQDYQDQFLRLRFDSFVLDQNIKIISDYKECQSYIKQKEKEDINNEFIIVNDNFVNNMCKSEDIKDIKKVEIDNKNKKIIFSSNEEISFLKNNETGYIKFKEIENQELHKNYKNNFTTENNINNNIADGTQNISQIGNRNVNDIILFKAKNQNKNNSNNNVPNEKNEITNEILLLNNNKDKNNFIDNNEKKDEKDKCTIIPNKNNNNVIQISKEDLNNNNNNKFNDSNISDGNFIEASSNNIDNNKINNFGKTYISTEGAFMEVSINKLIQPKNENSNNNNNKNNDNSNLNKNILEINNSNIINKNKNNIDLDFIKSIIQCLLNINSLRNYFLSKKENFLSIPKNTEEKSFSKLFSDILYNSYDENSNKYPYNLNGFNEILKQEKNIFIVSSESNIQNFFIYERMHNELNEKDKNNEIDDFYSYQTYPEIELYKCLNNFENRNNSIISQLFYYSEGNIRKCNKCNICLYNFTMHNIIIFPLKKIKIYKEKNNKSLGKIDILDCFEYHSTEENNNIDNNDIFCKECKQEYEISNKISTLPEIFTVFLDREECNDFEFKIDYIIEDLDKYMIKFNNIFDNQKSSYELIGIVVKGGKVEKNEEFLNYSKFSDDKWYLNINNKFEFVSEPILEIKNIPYLLIYQKIKK